MHHQSPGRALLCAAVFLVPPAVNGQEIAHEEALTPLDTVTIIGRRSDVADVPGSAHVIDEDVLGIPRSLKLAEVTTAANGSSPWKKTYAFP